MDGASNARFLSQFFPSAKARNSFFVELRRRSTQFHSDKGGGSLPVPPKAPRDSLAQGGADFLETPPHQDWNAA